MTFHGKRLGCGTNRMPTSVVYRGFDWLGQTDNQLLFCLPLIVFISLFFWELLLSFALQITASD